MKLNSAILRAALLVGLLAISQAANADTAFYVDVNDVYVRSHPGGYAMGRLYRNQRMDIQYIDPNGWAYGYAYGYVNRCVWVQFRDHGNTKFWTHGTTVSTKCRATNRYLSPSEYTNGEVWGDTDGMPYFLPRETHMWDNWVWGVRWGNANHRGVAPAGSLWKIRYTTNDGGGVMARPCNWTGNWSTTTCYSDWIFIQRSAIN